MAYVSDGFTRRVDHAAPRRRKPGQGARPVTRSEGLIVMRPRRGLRLRLGPRLLLLPLAVLLGARLCLALYFDPQAYAQWQAGLSGTGAAGRALAWALTPDPVTQGLAAALAPLL
ncbi:hypothetical protein [Limimaricola pyoseonensis]|uniref:Uncharacterized protein n=1 Tax=Limimaricola pyoseonensis TaxID=521013 RepID=A0A1G7CIX5_9RHOB|nr:hypothetical protein [Limimaricola pyoseonensis]SDE39203.1 hypothetical protein SAMN04488567_1516 [Limimaricola pyoseonensis]